MPRSGKIATAVAELHGMVLAMREVLAACAIAAGHDLSRLTWEHRPGFEERWDLMRDDGRWLGGVIINDNGHGITVCQATARPVDVDLRF